MKQIEGKIVSTKMSKTVVVEVERMVKHYLYQKISRHSKKFKAQNLDFDLKEGDRVKITPVRPISKDTHYKVIAKL